MVKTSPKFLALSLKNNRIAFKDINQRQHNFDFFHFFVGNKGLKNARDTFMIKMLIVRQKAVKLEKKKKTEVARELQYSFD